MVIDAIAVEALPAVPAAAQPPVWTTWMIAVIHPRGRNASMSPGKSLLRWSVLGLAALLMGFTSDTAGDRATRAASVAPHIDVGAPAATRGEPVPGAEIYIELDPGNEPFKKTTTDANGVFRFSFPPGRKAPSSGTFVMTVVPSRQFAARNAVPSGKPDKLRVPFVFAKDGPNFEYVLLWNKPDGKTYNRGSFAVSGKSQT